MTDADILKQAIETAQSRGFRWYSTHWKIIEGLLDAKQYYRVIFSHDFAKAFWGEEPEDLPGYVPDGEDPNDYLPPCRFTYRKWYLRKIP